MSFFDEADEPRTAVRRPAPRSTPPRRRAGGGGGGRSRPPYDPEAIRRRRFVLLVVAIVFLILVAILVNACQVNQRNTALEDYNSNVVSVITQSNSTGNDFFHALTGGGGAQNIQTAVYTARDNAHAELRKASGFSVPSEDTKAQQYLLLALQMRADALGKIGDNIQKALSGTAKTDAITTIAAEMEVLYASDVVYKNYVLPLELGALKAAGLTVSGPNALPQDTDQFVPDVRWVQPTFVAAQLKVNYAPAQVSSGPPAPGVHGHELLSVSVDGTTLSPTGTNNVSASPAPTFVLNFQNDGTNVEHNVVCQVTAAPTSGTAATVTGQAVVAMTTPGAPTTCSVTLASAPATGSYTVTARIERVPGETSTVHNAKTFPVNFQ